MNVYESSTQKVIPAVLLYAFYQNQLLMISKNVWNGLGGKLDLGESPLMAAVREFEEEANCKTTPLQWQWLGQLFFPNFKSQKNQDWWVTVYITDLTETQVKQIPINDIHAKEGPLYWIPCDKVMGLKTWDGDQKFLPYVLSRTPFQGTFFYEAGKCVTHEIAEIRSIQ